MADTIVIPQPTWPEFRPQIPFVLNRESPQADGLVYCATPVNGRLVGWPLSRMTQAKIFGGAPTSDPFLATANGYCAQTERTGASGVWDTTLDPVTKLSNLTIAYWIYPLPSSAGIGYWGAGILDTGSECFCETGREFFVGNGGTNQDFSLGDPHIVGEWQHIVWVRTLAGLKVYRNGFLRASASATGQPIATSAGASFYIGGAPAGTGNNHSSVQALWADFRVYNVEWNAAMVFYSYDVKTRWDHYLPQRTPMIATAVAPPATFSPYWGVQANHVYPGTL